MSNSPAFQFYPDDFLGGTQDFTQSEIGSYLLLLCHQWNSGSIPVEPARQQVIARGEVTEHVLSKFKKDPDGKLRQPRLEKVRKIQQEYRGLQSKKGVLSGISRRTSVEQRLNIGLTGVEPEHEPNLNRESTLQSPSPISLIQGGGKAAASSLKEVFDEWNNLKVFPQTLVLSDKRRRSLEARLKNPFFREHWKAAMQKATTSDFCKGKNDRLWKATFDWFITPDAVAKIMEGKYDNRTKSQSFVPDATFQSIP
jgi:uncharacterized protein YdaU (DUF1376 family)